MPLAENADIPQQIKVIAILKRCVLLLFRQFCRMTCYSLAASTLQRFEMICFRFFAEICTLNIRTGNTRKIIGDKNRLSLAQEVSVLRWREVFYRL